MVQILNNINIIAANTGHLNIILMVGIIVFGGTVGARIFQKLRIPQVVGYIIIGLLLGESALNLVPSETVEKLGGFSMFALGIIGFMIGGELRADVFKKHGKQFIIILCSEGIVAFLLVGAATSLAAWFFMGDLHTAIALGLVLGAIASATAPAATTNVLWEYKTRGPLTSTILAIVALDDGLALLLYGFGSSIANALLGNGSNSVWLMVAKPAYEIIGSIVLGVAAGAILHFILKFIKDHDKTLAFTIASVLLVIGAAKVLGLGVILSSITLGATVANLAHPQKKRFSFELVEKFSPPLYVMFFVLAGAHLKLNEVQGWVLGVVIIYLLCRTAGKILGSWAGAKYAKAPNTVRKFLGICLLSQAGVAIGLAILASRQFDGGIGNAVIMIVMTTTFIVEIIGPTFVKLGVKKAGEIGLNITEEDLVKDYYVGDVMDKNPTIINNDLPIKQILETFSRSESLYYPVIDKEGSITGVITIADIKETFANQDAAGWLLACDVAEPVLDKTTPDKSLEEALEYMKHFNLENMPVVDAQDSDKLLGVLDFRAVNRKISAEVLNRRQLADEMAAKSA